MSACCEEREMATKKKQTESEVEIVEMNVAKMRVHLLGITPLVCNAMSAKVMQGLLCPGQKKNQAERNSTLKHNPIEEFRSSPYIGEEGPTLIQALAVWFKRSLASAARDSPGAKKSEVGRRCWFESPSGGERVPLYGVPQMSMMVVRSADMNKTPDIRTRAILPRWACI